MIKNTLSKRIEETQRNRVKELRDYIGASSIGADCVRQLWYTFKGYEGDSIAPSIKRTWDIGKKLELLVIHWLVDSGFLVNTIPITYIDSELYYFQGHVDGVITIEGESSILEIKTAKDSSYKLFEKKGLKGWNPQYYAQIQSYMGMSGLFSAYILVLNKDNSLISDELVIFDKPYYEKLKTKAKLIYNAVIPPPKINGSPLWFQCKTCQFKSICHKISE